MAIIGAHVSVAGGLSNCFNNAESIGADCLQFFGASPRQWKARLPSRVEVEEYKREEKRHGGMQVFLHASYLVNLGSSLVSLRKKSVANLAAHLKIVQLLGANGLIFHIGSAGSADRRLALKQVAQGVKEVLVRVPGQARLILENSAGGGGRLGTTPEEIGEILNLTKSRRVKVCLDTQHAYAAGLFASYSRAEINSVLKRCENSFGLENIVALHVNDSLGKSGSFHDRHENIGNGYIGLGGFKNLAESSALKKLPWILEVPGFAGAGPDKRNVEILKKLLLK